MTAGAHLRAGAFSLPPRRPSTREPGGGRRPSTDNRSSDPAKAQDEGLRRRFPLRAAAAWRTAAARRSPAPRGPPTGTRVPNASCRRDLRIARYLGANHGVQGPGKTRLYRRGPTAASNRRPVSRPNRESSSSPASDLRRTSRPPRRLCWARVTTSRPGTKPFAKRETAPPGPSPPTSCARFQCDYDLFPRRPPPTLDPRQPDVVWFGGFDGLTRDPPAPPPVTSVAGGDRSVRLQRPPRVMRSEDAGRATEQTRTMTARTEGAR